MISLDAPDEQVLKHPPLVVIEVLDEEDRFCATMEKLADFARFGVEHIWIIDPERRFADRYIEGGLEKVQTVDSGQWPAIVMGHAGGMWGYGPAKGPFLWAAGTTLLSYGVLLAKKY